MSEQRRRVSLLEFAEYLEKFGMVIRYNQLTKEIEYSNMPEWYAEISDTAGATPTYIREEFSQYLGGTAVPLQTIHEYIYAIADRYAYHPVKSFFDNIRGTWDGVDRFPRIFDMLGVTDEFHQTLIRKWFYQCVALAGNSIKNPIGAEGVLILSGAEGMGKSQFFQNISPDPKWFRDKCTKLRLGNKDDLLSTVSGFIVELGEIDDTIRCNGSELKSFITAASDTIRRPYHRQELTTPRTTSFAGTTNKPELLTDEAGYRRWWLVPVNVNVNDVISFTHEDDKTELCQLWAQCVSCVDADRRSFRLTKEEQEKLAAQNVRAMILPEGVEEIMEILDFESPVSEWVWIRPGKFQEKYVYRLPRNMNAAKVGQAFTFLQKTYPTIEKKSPKGITQWLVPEPRKPVHGADRSISA